jgi:hypothetical protein
LAKTVLHSALCRLAGNRETDIQKLRSAKQAMRAARLTGVMTGLIMQAKR